MEEKAFKFQVKAVKANGEFEGYASTFGNVDSYNEVVVSGAFKKTLQEKKAFPLLWYHDPKDVIGVVEAEEDKKGLRVQGKLNLDVQSAREKYALLKQKAIKGMSIGFRTIKDKIEDDIRYLLELELGEVSLGTFPVNEEAFVDTVKSELPEKMKPGSNEHSALLYDPKKCDPKSFEYKQDGEIYGGKVKVPKSVSIITAKSKDKDHLLAQALRFPTSSWTVEEAKSWLKENEIHCIKFDPAKKSLSGLLKDIQGIIEIKEGRLFSSQEYKLMDDIQRGLKALLKANEPVETTHSGEEPQKEDKPSDEGYLLSELQKFTHSLDQKLNGGK